MPNASHRYKLLESGKVAAPIQRGPHHEICDAICRKSQAAYDAWLETDSDDAGDPPPLLTVDEFRARCNPEIEAEIRALKAAKAA